MAAELPHFSIVTAREGFRITFKNFAEPLE